MKIKFGLPIFNSFGLLFYSTIYLLFTDAMYRMNLEIYLYVWHHIRLELFQKHEPLTVELRPAKFEIWLFWSKGTEDPVNPLSVDRGTTTKFEFFWSS